jgi:serine/threonine protein kinase
MEVLGVGSTSNVHRCLNNKNDNYYACKIIDKYQMEDRFAGMMAQFQTEIEALKQLQHPSIIQLFDVYLTEDKIYIIMELMEGGELFDYVVQKGTLNEEEASHIVRRVTSALVYMHDKVCKADAPKTRRSSRSIPAENMSLVTLLSYRCFPLLSSSEHCP